MPPEPIWDDQDGDREFRVYDVGRGELLFDVENENGLVSYQMRWGTVEGLIEALDIWIRNPK